MHSLLAKAVGGDSKWDPAQIEKAVVFVDGKTSIANMLQFLRDSLVELSKSTDTIIDFNDARRIIDFYTGETPVYDQDTLYKDWGEVKQSTCRIKVEAVERRVVDLELAKCVGGLESLKFAKKCWKDVVL